MFRGIHWRPSKWAIRVAVAAIVLLLLAVGPYVGIRSQCSEYANQPVINGIASQSEDRETSGGNSQEQPITKFTLDSSSDALKTTISRTYRTYYPPESRFDWPRHFWCEINGADYILAYFTIILAGSTIGMWLATEKLWREGAKALEIGERAFVSLDDFHYEVSVKPPDSLTVTYFAFQPRWKNAGNTPTRNMRIRVGWRPPNGELPPNFAYPYRDNAERPFFLGPKSTQGSDVIEEITGDVIRDLIKRMQTAVGVGVPLFFIWGRADYEDIFGKSHWFQWCYRVRPERHDRDEKLRVHFIQWGNYNRSDEDERQ